MEKSSNQPCKVKFACMLCRGDHLLRDCPNIPKVLEVWSTGSHCPLSSSSRDHDGEKSSTSDSKVHGQKDKLKFPSKLREGIIIFTFFPYIEEASKVLENLTYS